MAGERVLVVDDNAVNLKLARIVLEEADYDVRTATEAESAIELVASFQPAIILMDLQLPGVNGLELTRRLKADPAHAQIVIVALTAYAMKGDDDKAFAAGCDGYITKPIDTIELPLQVARYLRR